MTYKYRKTTFEFFCKKIPRDGWMSLEFESSVFEKRMKPINFTLLIWPKPPATDCSLDGSQKRISPVNGSRKLSFPCLSSQLSIPPLLSAQPLSIFLFCTLYEWFFDNLISQTEMNKFWLACSETSNKLCNKRCFFSSPLWLYKCLFISVTNPVSSFLCFSGHLSILYRKSCILVF